MADPATAATDRETSPWVRFGLALFLVAVVGIVFGPALEGEYVYDDELLLGPSNPATASVGAALERFDEPLWAFDRPAENVDTRAMWRPLTVVALAIGRALDGGDPFGPHLVSLLLHIAATLAAWRLAARLLGGELAGLGAALLFALHPVQVESVAWASSVNDPLWGALGLLAMLAHLRWREELDARGVPILGPCLVLAAMLSKEQALVLPVLIVGLELARGRRLEARALAPYAVALGAWYLGRAVVFRDVFAGLLARQGDFGFPSWQRAAAFRIELLGGFLQLVAWPSDLAIFRPVRPVLPEGSRAVLVALLWIAGFGVALTLLLVRRMRVAAFGLAIPVVSAALVIAALHTAGRFPLSDRYLYVAVFGAALAFVDVARRAKVKALAPLAVVALAFLLGRESRAHLPDFRDPLAFHDAAAASAPRDAYVQRLAGRARLKEYQRTLDHSELERAYLHFLLSLAAGTDYGSKQIADDPALPMRERLARLERMVIHTDPSELRDDPTAFFTVEDRLEANLGQLYVHLFAGELAPVEDLDVPLRIAEQLVKVFSDRARTWTAKGQVHEMRGEWEEAEESFRKAIELDRTDVLAWRHLARVLTARKDDAGARVAYQEALRLLPSDRELLSGALAAAIREGQLPVARTYLERLVALAPGTREAAYWRGRLAMAEKRPSDALAAFDRALEIDEGYGEAMKHRGLALLALGEQGAALEAFADAARAMPDDFESHYQVAALLLRMPEPQRDQVWRDQTLDMLLRAYMLSPPDEKRLALQQSIQPFVEDDPDALFSLATSLEKRNDLTSALHWLRLTEKVTDAWPAEERAANRALVLTRMGSILRRDERYRAEALELLREAFALAPDSFDAAFEYATALRAAGELAELGKAARSAQASMPEANIAPEFRRAVSETIEMWIRESDAAGGSSKD